MSGFWNAIVEHLIANHQVYITAAIAFAFAAVKCMPETIPTSAQALWTWLRSSLQTALPVPAANHPIQPVSNPAQPK